MHPVTNTLAKVKEPSTVPITLLLTISQGLTVTHSSGVSLIMMMVTDGHHHDVNCDYHYHRHDHYIIVYHV